MRRGIKDAAQARAFFSGALGPGPDPFRLPDMEAAIIRLRRALAAHEPIAVYGDFDVDGISATAILSEGLRDLGGAVRAFIPNRFHDGYGVTSDALRRLAADGASVVITVDCGISAVAETRQAKQLGLDVIVVDHHEPGPELPDAVAVIDPKRPASAYPTRDLCSGALAFRVLQALYGTLGTPLDESRFLDLAALATVCDMVPLQGENRDLVRAGLPAVAGTRRPGLRALLRAAAADGEPPDAETLGFRIGPRLNAAGRLDDASVALEILTTADERRAEALAQRLTELNRQRQQALDAALLVAQALAEGEQPDAPVLVVGDARISRGIVGLVASRLAELYRRPAFVYEESADGCVGSARGVPGFDVVRALAGARAILSRYGGHQAAGGFALETRHLPEFKEHLWQASAEQRSALVQEDTIEVDAREPLRALDRAVLSYLERFAPCGVGNPRPLLLSERVQLLTRRAVGGGKHLMLDVRDGAATWRAFAFGRGAETPRLGSTLDIVYSVEKGSRGFGPRLRLLDWHESSTTGV